MLLNQLFEAITRTGKGDTAVVGWGRGMGHKGHMMLASSVITKAKEVGGDPYFVVSRTVGKDDPITPEEKLAIYKKVFPEQGHIFQAASDEIPDLTKVLANLNKQGYKNAVVVVGADQVKAFQYLKNYNGKPTKAGDIPFEFDNLEVISRQETNDPSAGEEGPRATPMRQALNDPNKSEEEQFAVWRDAMSPEVSDDEVRDLMNKAKTRMGAFVKPKKEGMEEDKAGWSIKGSPKPAPKAPTPHWRLNKDGTATDLNTGITYNRDGSVVKTEEGFTQSHADANKLKYQKAGRVGHGIGWKEYGDDYKEIVDDIVDKFDNITRIVQYDQLKTPDAKHKMVERYFKKYGYPFELFNDVIAAIDHKIEVDHARANIKKENNVEEGFVFLSPKEKGSIQNIVSQISDIPGMWDHAAQTFTDAGMGRLKAALKDNSKYIKYAVNLTADDFEEDVDEHIVKVKGGYELKSKHGNKNLGKYPTKAGAEKRERQVQYFKHAGESVEEEKQRLDPKCWTGYRKQGTKMKGGKRVNNCVKIGEGWEDIMTEAVTKLFKGK